MLTKRRTRSKKETEEIRREILKKERIIEKIDIQGIIGIEGLDQDQMKEEAEAERMMRRKGIIRKEGTLLHLLLPHHPPLESLDTHLKKRKKR